MRIWILANAIANEDELLEIEKNAKDFVKKMQLEAWDDYLKPIKKRMRK